MHSVFTVALCCTMIQPQAPSATRQKPSFPPDSIRLPFSAVLAKRVRMCEGMTTTTSNKTPQKFPAILAAAIDLQDSFLF